MGYTHASAISDDSPQSQSFKRAVYRMTKSSPHPSHHGLLRYTIRLAPAPAPSTRTRQHVRRWTYRYSSWPHVSSLSVHLMACADSNRVLNRTRLFGLTVHQVYRYFRLYPTDPRYIQIYVSPSPYLASQETITHNDCLGGYPPVRSSNGGK